LYGQKIVWIINEGIKYVRTKIKEDPKGKGNTTGKRR
jgi:hypothetical protein